MKEENKKEPLQNIDETLELLPEEEKQALIQKEAAIEESTSFQGPIPPPEILGEYEKVLSGAAERILAMAEKEQSHRHKNDDLVVNKSMLFKNRGQIWGGTLAFSFGIIALVLGLYGHDWLAGIFGTTTIVGIASAFLSGTKKEKGQDAPPESPQDIESEVK